MSAPPPLPLMPPALARAGCRLVVDGRKLVLLDRGGVELERGPAGQLDWLLAAGSLALIRRLAQRLGLRDELHPKELRVRLWWPKDDPETVPWRSFEAALDWLTTLMAVPAVAKRVRVVAAMTTLMSSCPARQPMAAAGVAHMWGRAPPRAFSSHRGWNVLQERRV
ncbi:MAG TPA: hypothetical protein VFS21_37510 [Roseiflexaceae bacterium]|nr:hypothetical protein [Roseiflexaceae bacterium]